MQVELIVVGMRMMGSMLISSLIIFPALCSMRVFKSFKAVTVCSAVISVVTFIAGMVIDRVTVPAVLHAENRAPRPAGITAHRRESVQPLGNISVGINEFQSVITSGAPELGNSDDRSPGATE